MLMRNAIRLENTDSANPQKLREALNLVGGEQCFPSLLKQYGRDVVHPDLKSFNYIFANDFTLIDVKKAVAVIHRRKDELYASASELDKDMPVMADGIRASADLAVRLATEFTDNLKDDLAQSHPQ